MSGKHVTGKTGKTEAPKRVVKPAGAAPHDRCLVWRFGRLDHETQFGCQTLPKAHVKELEGELAVFQGQPIPTLLDKRWLKFIPADDMTPDGQKELAKVSTQEEGLWQLHLHRHKWRIYGYFADPEFFFLWWDGDHDVATGRSRTRKSH